MKIRTILDQMNPGCVAGEDEERLLHEANARVVQQGLPAGEALHELAAAATGEPRAVLDLAWPDRGPLPDACRGIEPLETETKCRRVGRSGLRSSRRVDPLPPRGEGPSWAIQSLGTERRSEPGRRSRRRRRRASAWMVPSTPSVVPSPVRSAWARPLRMWPSGA